MTELFFRIILPLGLVGSFACLALLAAHPLLRRQKPAWRKVAFLVAGLLYILPLFLLWPTGNSPIGTGFTQAVDSTLKNAAPTAPVYRMGQALHTAASQAAAAQQPATPAGPVAQTTSTADALAGKAVLPPAKPAALSLATFAPRLAALLYFTGLALAALLCAARYLLFMRRLRKSCRAPS